MAVTLHVKTLVCSLYEFHVNEVKIENHPSEVGLGVGFNINRKINSDIQTAYPRSYISRKFRVIR